MIFLPVHPRRAPLFMAAPLAGGLAAVLAAFVALWGLGRAGRAVPVELPKVSGRAEALRADFPGHVITVRPDGGYVLGGSRLPRSELEARLKRLGKLRSELEARLKRRGKPAPRDERILIRADANVPFGKVVDLLEICREAGLSSVRFEVLEESAP